MKKKLNSIFNINPKYSTIIAFILGLILIDDFTAAEQNAIGEWLILIGQTLLTNSGLQVVVENRVNNYNTNINSKELKSIYNPVMYDIEKTKELLKEIYPNNKNSIDILSKAINNPRSTPGIISTLKK